MSNKDEQGVSKFLSKVNTAPRPRDCPEQLTAIMALLCYYTEGLLGGEVMPEAYRPALDSESRAIYHYFTLPMALNYRRSSYHLWKAALRTFTDPATRFVFYPREVVLSPEETLRTALRKYGLALLPKQHIKIWQTISQGIVDYYDGDIRNLFRKHEYKASLIRQEISKEKRKAFPYLGGYKIVNYWLYVIWQYTDPPLLEKDALSVAPDTHIVKSSIMLGLLPPSALQNKPAQQAVKAWESLFVLNERPYCQGKKVTAWMSLIENGLSPIDMHYALWLWSRQGFNPPVYGTLPLRKDCTERLLRKPFWKRRRVAISRIVLGSNNPAKKEMVSGILSPLGIEVVTPDDLGIHLQVDERGNTPQENARRKVLAYMKVIDEPVLSIDNALYIKGLPANKQPGLYVRRLPGSNGRPSDHELLKYYLSLIRSLGGEAIGLWEFAFAIADISGKIYEKTILSPRRFVSKASGKMIPGYPLESIQIDPKSGKYISEMTDEERSQFWRETIGGEVEDIVLRVVRRNPAIE